MAKKPHDPTFEIDAVVSSSSGVVFKSADFSIFTATPLNEGLLEDERVFDYRNYSESDKHAPIPLPEIDLNVLNKEYPRCLDMPIRMANESSYYLPEEWEELLPLIQDIVDNERTHNPHWRDYYTYMTVDCGIVKPDEQQRHGGLHVDGFQGERINPKTKITRNYVMTTNGGTRFYPQKFVVVDPAKFNVFQGFDLQAEEPIIADENVVYFMDAYSVHESGLASHGGLRTFLRVTFDLKVFDRLGNTHNSMLDYDWDMVTRTVHEEVTTPTMKDVEGSPYKT